MKPGETPSSGNIIDSKDGGSLGNLAQTKGAVVMTTTEEVSNDPEGEVEIFAHTTYLEGQSMYGNNDLIAIKATFDPDTLYHHEAMKEPDAAKFEDAMGQEWEGQVVNGNFQSMLKSEVPKRAKILPSVWQLKRKRDVSTGEIKRYKARLNLDGSRMEQGVDYQLTYAPVAKWQTIRLCMILSIINGWQTVQIDYVLAFPSRKKCI